MWAVHATVRNQIEKVFRPLTLTTEVHTKYQVFMEDVISRTILKRRWYFFSDFLSSPYILGLLHTPWQLFRHFRRQLTNFKENFDPSSLLNCRRLFLAVATKTLNSELFSWLPFCQEIGLSYETCNLVGTLDRLLSSREHFHYFFFIFKCSLATVFRFRQQ